MNARARTAAASAGALVAAAVLGAGLAAPAGAAGQGAESSKGAGGGKAMKAEGAFTVGPDVTFGAPVPVRGEKCRLTVNGTLNFTGDVVGAAVGTTTAVVFASCEEATAAPPGTYFDVFKFKGDFAGTVFDEPAEGTLTYAGVTQEGGAIEARIKLRGDAWAVLRAKAEVLVGGDYLGKAKPPASTD